VEAKFKKLQRAKTADCRVIINATIGGVAIRVLLDSGAHCNAISKAFVKENRESLAPFIKGTVMREASGIVDGAPTMASTESLTGLFHSGEYAETLSVPVYPINDPNFEMLLGRPWHTQNRFTEDYDSSLEESVKVRPRPKDGKYQIHIVSSRQLLPFRTEEVEAKPGVYSISSLNREPGLRGLAELEFASHQRFKKVQKQALNQERKEVKSKAKGVSFKKTMIAALLTCAAVGTLVATADTDAASAVTSAVASVLASLSTVVYTVGQAGLKTAAAYGGAPTEVIDRINIMGDDGKTFTCTPKLNPFLPPSTEILGQMNQTMPDMAKDLGNFLGRAWKCKQDMPHKSEIKRAPEDSMSIHFKPGFENFVPRGKMYKTPKHMLPVMKQCLIELAEKGFIQPSTSPFSAGCMLIAKPHQEGVPLEDLKYRLVVDLRDINALTVPLHHKIPDICSIWHNLADAEVISVLDLTKGFHQLNLNQDDGSAAKTAFSTEFGHWEFVGCVMGARNTPAYFQNRVEQALREADLLDVGVLRLNPKTGKISELSKTPCCTPYIDDLLVYSKRKDHFRDLEKVFQCLDDNQFYIQLPKCHFCCKYALFCGGIVGNGILAMDPIKIEAIENWEKPTNITELRSFLGMANYLKAWYKNYSDHSGILTNLLKKGKCVSKDWSLEHDKAFRALKEGFKKYPVLRLPDFKKQFYLVTDSCDHALGGMVAQLYEHEGKKILLPVAYHSRKFSKHEVNYSVREQECLAIIDCFKKYEYLLVGSPFEVIMKTDHSSLKQVEQGGSLQSSKRLARWAEYLGNFAYSVCWIPGSKNLVGDGISRSINSDTGTVPISGDKVRVPQELCPMSTFTGDERLSAFNYNTSKEFKVTFEKLSRGETDIHLHPEIRYFEKLGKKLYYKLSDGTRSLCVPEGHRFCVDPKVSRAKLPVREILLRECHDSPYMGHRGVNKTYAQMRKLFYWKSMHRDVRRYVSTCATCMRAKASTRGEMLPCKGKECPAGPMHSIAIDFIAGMPPVEIKMFPGRKITTAAVLVDRFTKKVFIEPMPEDSTAEEVAQTLHGNVFLEHGWPLELISDRDTKFTSKFWKKLFEMVGTKLSFGYAYHQRFDGQTESLNRVIKEIMRCYLDYKQENWVEQLPHIASCINNSINTQSGYSPNEIYYNRQLLRPIEQQFGQIKGFESVTAFLEESVHKRLIAEEVVRQGVVSYVKQFNKKVPLTVLDPRLVPGKLVFVNAQNIKQPNLTGRPSRKLDPKRVGPFKILEKVGSTGFLLDMPKYPHHKEFHAHSLTPYEEGLEFESRAALKSADHKDVETGLDMYIVSHLAARKKHYRKWYYFVVYEGYDIAEGEWILRSDLEIDCPELVVKFDLIDPLPPNSGVSQIKIDPKSIAPTPEPTWKDQIPTKFGEPSKWRPRRNPRRAVRAQPASTGDGVGVTL
jgi:hypothetical protein